MDMFTAIRPVTFAAALAVSLPSLGNAAVVIADGDLAGSLLNVFNFGYPTDNIDVSVSGTVTSSDMDPSLVGTQLQFQSDLLSGNNTITLNGSTLVVSDMTPTGVSDFDPNTGTDGVIVFNMISLNTPVSFITVDPLDPDDFDLWQFTFEDPWSAFGMFPGPPDLPLTLTIFYEGDFPTKFFNDAPVGAPPSLIPYTEGGFQVTRLTLGTEIGTPPPAPQVPLPLSGLLLVSGLGALGLSRRRQS